MSARLEGRLSNRGRAGRERGRAARERTGPAQLPAGPVTRFVLPAAAVAFLAVIPHWSFTQDDTFFWTEILIAILFAMATNLLFGYSGLVSFGQASFFGAGVYTVGMMVSKGQSESMPVNMLLAITIGGALALAMGALIVRTTGLAFAILTLAFGQLFATMVFKERVFGGENGLSGLLRGHFGPFDLRPVNNFYYFTLAALVVAVAVMWLIVSSPFGLTMRSIRDDADRAQFIGVRVQLYKLGVFTIAGAFSGLAGALHAYQNVFASAEVFGLERSTEPVLMAILGGVHFFFGPAVGAVAYEWLRHWLQARTASWILWIGLGLVVIIVALRNGIVGLFHQVRVAARGWRGPGPHTPAGDAGDPDGEVDPAAVPDPRPRSARWPRLHSSSKV